MKKFDFTLKLSIDSLSHTHTAEKRRGQKQNDHHQQQQKRDLRIYQRPEGDFKNSGDWSQVGGVKALLI